MPRSKTEQTEHSSDDELWESESKYTDWEVVLTSVENIMSNREKLTRILQEPEQYTPEQRGEVGRILAETQFPLQESTLDSLQEMETRLIQAVKHYRQPQ